MGKLHQGKTVIVALVLLYYFLSCQEERTFRIPDLEKTVWNGVDVNDNYFEISIFINQDSLYSSFNIFNGPAFKEAAKSVSKFTMTGCLRGNPCEYYLILEDHNQGNLVLPNGEIIMIYKVQNFFDSNYHSSLMTNMLFEYRRFLCLGLDTFTYNKEASTKLQSEKIEVFLKKIQN